LPKMSLTVDPDDVPDTPSFLVNGPLSPGEAQLTQLLHCAV
jgi:hypothetical protein